MRWLSIILIKKGGLFAFFAEIWSTNSAGILPREPAMPMLSAKVKVIVVAFGAWPSLPSIKWWLLPPAREAQCRCRCRCVMGVICIESSFEAWTGFLRNKNKTCQSVWGKMAGISGTYFGPSSDRVGAQSTQRLNPWEGVPGNIISFKKARQFFEKLQY